MGPRDINLKTVRKRLGKKCFKCQKFGHVASKCNATDEDEPDKKVSTVNAITLPPVNKMIKEVVINNRPVNALIDTGSQVTLVCRDVYDKIRSSSTLDSVIGLAGFGRGEVRSLGCFETYIEIDREQFYCTVHVVPNGVMSTDMIIGSDLLTMCETIVNADGITIRRMTPEQPLAQINIVEQALDIESNLQSKFREEVKTIVSSHEVNKCKTTDVCMRIVPKDKKPIFQKPRRLLAPEREIVEKQIAEWINEGVIEECTSEYASPVVIVKKKDGSPRVCIDYRKLNRIIEKDGHPLPIIEDVLDKLGNAKVFSTLDLKNGFFHVPVEKDSRKYTAFVTHWGQYQFLRAPFGLCNSPRVFQRYVNSALWELVRKNIVLLYVDDLIIPAECEQEALDRLRLVLKTISEHGLVINFKKMSIFEKINRIFRTRNKGR